MTKVNIASRYLKRSAFRINRGPRQAFRRLRNLRILRVTSIPNRPNSTAKYSHNNNLSLPASYSRQQAQPQ